MNIETANSILRRTIGSDRWYFERRGWKIWLVEELNQTFNRIMPLTTPAGDLCGEVNDSHVRFAIGFVYKKRKYTDVDKFDIKRQVVSGMTGDDVAGKQSYQEEYQ